MHRHLFALCLALLSVAAGAHEREDYADRHERAYYREYDRPYRRESHDTLSDRHRNRCDERSRARDC